MECMAIEDEWLSQILGESTKKAYRRQLGYFKEFMGVKSVEELLKLREKERNFETRVIQFFSWLQKDKGLTGNSARACCIPVQSLFSYTGLPLKLKNKLPKMHMKIENWKPSLDDLQRIYKLNNLSVKAWMSLSRDCPARMSDLLRITPEQIQQGEFLLLSKKENVTGKVYISEDTKTLFQQLKTAKIELPKTQRGVDKMMENACRVVGLERRINQHLFRKLWISMAINLGLNETIIKILSFKSVPQELLTYFLDRMDLKDSWKRVIEAMSLESRSNGNGRIKGMEEELEELRIVMRVLAKYIQPLKQMVSYKRRFSIEDSKDDDVVKKFLEEG